MELTVSKIETGVITWNYENLKTALSEKMEKFKDLVVTEESLKDCQQTQRDLASLRTAIDTKRKEVKKRLQEPADEFDKKCKDLLSIITGVENPIKDGINVFEEKRKDSVREDIQKEINIFQEEFKLSEKYLNRITISEKWLNKTQKFKDTLTELHGMFSTLQMQDESEKKDRESIEELCRTASEDLGTVISPKGYLDLYALGTSLSVITSDIMREAQRRKSDEEKIKTEAKEEAKEEAGIDIGNPSGSYTPTLVKNVKGPISETKTITLEITGTVQQFNSLREYFSQSGMTYKQV